MNAASGHSEVERALDQAQQTLAVALSGYQPRSDRPQPAAEFYSSEEKLEPVLDAFVRRSRGRPVRLRAVLSRRPKIEMRTAMLRHLRRRLRGGSTVHVLSPPAVALSPESHPDLDGLDAHRAEIRISQRELPDLTIMDGQLAILRTATPHGQPRIFVVHDAGIVREFSALYDVIWAEGIELRTYRPHGIEPDDELTTQILTLLNDGCKDEAAARKLGLSVRTYRRHVADIMTRLQVTSRFQAGVQAVRLGLLGDEPGIATEPTADPAVDRPTDPTTDPTLDPTADPVTADPADPPTYPATNPSAQTLGEPLSRSTAGPASPGRRQPVAAARPCW